MDVGNVCVLTVQIGVSLYSSQCFNNIAGTDMRCERICVLDRRSSTCDERCRLVVLVACEKSVCEMLSSTFVVWRRRRLMDTRRTQIVVQVGRQVKA